MIGQRVCIYLYLLFLLSYQFSIFGQVNNFAVVVGLNSSVRVARIRGEEYVLLLFLFFVTKLWLLSHGLVHISLCVTLMLAIVAPPFFYLSFR